jgi:hypothetical protein
MVQTGADSFVMYYDPSAMPPLSTFKKKGILVFKSRTDGKIDINNETVSNEVVMMEFTKNVLENLSLISQVHSLTYFLGCLSSSFEQPFESNRMVRSRI